MQADFDSVVRKLVEEAHLPREEIISLVEAKKKELAGLVSDLGAIHIIANELGILSEAGEQNRGPESRDGFS
jgi:hypothetical protein